MLSCSGSCSRVQNGNVCGFRVQTAATETRLTNLLWGLAGTPHEVDFLTLEKQAVAGDSACRFAALISVLAAADSRALPPARGRCDSYSSDCGRPDTASVPGEGRPADI